MLGKHALGSSATRPSWLAQGRGRGSVLLPSEPVVVGTFSERMCVGVAMEEKRGRHVALGHAVTQPRAHTQQPIIRKCVFSVIEASSP